jgi:hypothetical protein
MYYFKGTAAKSATKRFSSVNYSDPSCQPHPARPAYCFFLVSARPTLLWSTPVQTAGLVSD